MAGDIDRIEDILQDLLHNSKKKEIDTHDFIQSYTQRIQRMYVQWLAVQIMEHNESDPFRKVHRYIGEFLSENQKNSSGKLKIASNGQGRSMNIFGYKSLAKKWVKA